MDAADSRCFLRRVVPVQALLQHLEDRLRLHDAILSRHAVLALERGSDLSEPERLLPRLHRALLVHVVHKEDIVLAAAAQVGLAQERAGVGAQKEGQVGLLAHEVRVEQAFGNDDLRHGERDGGVGAGLDGDPPVGVYGRGVEVGADGDDARAVVPRLGQEMEIRDLRVRRVAAPNEDEIRVEVIVGRPARDGDAERHSGTLLLVADFGVEIEHHGAEQVREAIDRHPRGDACRVAVEDDGFRRIALEGIDDAFGDVTERLVPGDLLPPALAALAGAFERVRQARFAVHVEGVARSLLAAARVEVRDGGIRLRVDTRLFLVDNGAVLHEDVVGAATLVPAVEQVGAPGHAVPTPPFSVRVAAGFGRAFT